MIEGLYDMRAAKRDARELTSLLGDAFQRRLKNVEQGLASKTPPSDAQTHTLARAVVRLRRAPNELVPKAGSIEDRDREEVRTALALLRPWIEAPDWAKVKASMSAEYEHTLANLSVLRWLSEHQFQAKGYRAELAAEGTQRTADIRLYAPSGETEVLEVKAPRQLLYPKSLDSHAAQRLIEAALKRAGSTNRGQLRPADSPSLLISGVRLTDGDIWTVLNAIRSQLPLWRRTRKHVRAIGVLRVQVHSTPISRSVENGSFTTYWSSSVQVGAFFAINPEVEGQTILERSGMPLNEWRIPISRAS